MIRHQQATAPPAAPAPGARDGDPPDIGLCLLSARSGMLRWAPDPDAPALRTLAAGEARLGIRCFELSAAGLQRAVSGRRALHAGADARQWRALPVPGIAEVIESRVPGCPVGAMVQGRLHIGTHRVVRVADVDGSGFSAAAGEGAHAECHRYAWSAAGAMDAAVGLDAVEQAIDEAMRDQSHGAAPARLLSLAPCPSRCGRRPPICDASCSRPLQRLSTPDSSIGRLTT